MPTPPPLLESFFADSGGVVCYKGYQPHRGDDVPALLRLAGELPPTVQFVPIRPEIDSVTELRSHLFRLLCHPDLSTTKAWRDGVEQDPPKNAETRPLEQEEQDRLRDVLRSLIYEVLDSTDRRDRRPESIASLTDKVFNELATHHAGHVAMLLDMLIPNLRYLPASSKHDGAPRKSALRGLVHIPNNVPLLVVGRPELLHGYRGKEDRRSDLRRLLDEALYPNRFQFMGSRADSPSNRHGIIDRKTYSVYRQIHWSQDDVGFIFLGRSRQRQPVIVVTGFSSLGTYAAVCLLLERRPAFTSAVQRWKETTGQVCADIGFRCRNDQLDPDRPFSHVVAAQRLHIELLNPDDLLGYRWGREAWRRFVPLHDTWDESPRRQDEAIRETWTGPDRQERKMHWSWNVPQDVPGSPAPPGSSLSTAPAPSPCRLLRVEISATAYPVSDGQIILPGRKFGKLLDRVEAEALEDLAEWKRKLKAQPQVGYLDKPMRVETFNPILLLGASGVGKQWVAELIAYWWGGRTLEVEGARWQQPGDRELPNKLLDEGYAALKLCVKEFLEDTTPATFRLHVPNILGEGDLLASALFGMAARHATSVGSKPGAFLLAGTGLLFLDELLELPLPVQAQLLLALQNGRVVPLGAGKEYRFACRVVAATNRAEDEAGLRALIERERVRGDLTARMLRRYVVPPLRERAIEIVPLVVRLLRTRKHGTQPDPDESRPHYLCISRRAFEALITHDYSYENIRELRRLASIVPDDVFSGHSGEGLSLKELRQRSITLEHLQQAEILGTVHHEGHWEGEEFSSLVPEQDYYEFAVSYERRPDPVQPATFPVPGPADKPEEPPEEPRDAARPEANTELFDTLTRLEREGILASMKQRARQVWEDPDLSSNPVEKLKKLLPQKEDLLRERLHEDPFKRGFRDLLKGVLGCHLEGVKLHHALTSRKLKGLFRGSDTWKSLLTKMPLHDLLEADANLEEMNTAVQACVELFYDLSPAILDLLKEYMARRGSGRLPTLHSYVLLSILAGEALPRHE